MSRRVDGARGGFQARSRIRHGMGANAKSTAGSASRDLGGPAGQIHNPKAQKITTEGGQIEDRPQAYPRGSLSPAGRRKPAGCSRGGRGCYVNARRHVMCSGVLVRGAV